MHTRAQVEARRARQVLRIDAQPDLALAALIELAEGMKQQRHTEALFAPGTQHRQRAHPAFAKLVVAERTPGKLLAVEGQEEERRVETFALYHPMLPFLEVAGHMPEVVLEGRIDGLEGRPFVLPRLEGAQGDVLRPLWRGRHLVHVDLHAPRAANLPEALRLDQAPGLLGAT